MNRLATAFLVFAVLAPVALVACAATRANDDPDVLVQFTGYNAVTRVEDLRYGVVCYTHREGIACVKVTP